MTKQQISEVTASQSPVVVVADLDMATYGMFLACSEGCYGHYSATRGDYWFMAPNEPFICHECGAPMILARENVRLERVYPPVAS